MAVTITDHRTIVNEADSATGWSASSGSASLITSDPDPIETSGHIGVVVSTATVDCYYGLSSTSFTSKVMYVWADPKGAMDTIANGGMSIFVGDGTNQMAYHLGGSDKAVFRHDVTVPISYQCMVLHQSSLPSQKTTRAGSEGSLAWGAITQFGATFKTLAKSKGGTQNCFVDILRLADLTTNNGCVLSITGGTSGDKGTFDQIATADASTANQTAYGVVRKLGAGAYGVQGPLRFGNATGSSASWFEDKNVTVVFEDRGMATTVYKIFITDNGTGTTTFRLGTKVGSGSTATGADGCNFIAASGVGAAFDSGTDTDVDDVLIYGTRFSGFTGGLVLGAGGQELIGCAVTASGAITCASGVLLFNTTVDNTSVAANASALIWNINEDPDGNLDNMQFTMGATLTHAIEFGTTSPLTMTVRGINFVGYSASNNVNDSTFHIKRTTSTVTINAVGCSGNLSYRTDGATVSVVTSVSVQITVVDKNDNPIQNAQTALYVGATEVLNGDTNASGVLSGSYSGSTPANAIWKSRKGSPSATKYVPNSGPAVIASGTGLDIKVVLLEDTANNS